MNPLEDKAFVDITKNMIDTSLTTRGAIFQSYIAFTIEDMELEFYRENINILHGNIDPFIRDQVCYLKDKEEHEVEGSVLLNYFKKDLEFRGCQLIITILGLRKDLKYSIKTIFKSFNEEPMERRTAFAMSQLPRLSEHSVTRHLNQDSFRAIVMHGRMAHTNPLEHHTHDPNVMFEILEYIFVKEIFNGLFTMSP